MATAESTVKINIQVQDKTLGSLESKLTGVNEQLRNVGVGSTEFRELTKESQRLTSEIDKINREVQGFTFDEKIRSADGAVKLMGGSLSSIVGTLGVLGVESEAFGEFERKAASAIAVAVGFKDVSEGLQQLGPFLKQAGIAVTRFGKVTRAALLTAGVTAFVVAIGTIAAYWDDIALAIGLVQGENEKLNDSLNEELTIQEGILSVLESEKALIEGKGGSTAEVNKKLLDQLQIQIDITEQLIAQQQLMLAEEREENMQLSFWENLQLRIAKATGGSEAFAKALVDSVNPASEKTLELQTGITDAQASLNALRLKYFLLEDEYSSQVDRAADGENKVVSAIQSRGVALEGLTTAQITNTGATKEGLNALADKTIAENDAEIANYQQAASEEYKQQTLFNTGVALEGLSNVLGQNTKEGKALAIAGATINTYLAATEALKNPFPFNIIAAGVVVANGLATVKRISDTKVPGGDGGGGAPVTSAPPVANLLAGPTAQQQFQQDLLQDTTPQFDNIGPSIRAYVLSGDVTTAQEADAKLNNRRTLAG